MAIVGIQLTYFAPGCSDLKTSDPELWQWHFDQTATSILTWLTARLEQQLDQIAMRQEGQQTTVWAKPNDKEPLRLMAVIFDGLSFEDVAVARARMLGRFIPNQDQKAG